MRDGEGTLAGLHRVLLVAGIGEIGAQVRRYPAQAAVILQGFGERLGFAQELEHAPKVAQRDEHIAHLEPQVDRLLALGSDSRADAARRRAPAQSTPGPLAGPSAQTPWPLRAASRRRPCPRRSPCEKVVRQLGVVLFQPVRIELLNGLAHGLVEGLAPLQQETVVGHILDHGVLEDIGGFRHEPLLVDDLQGLQLAQQPVESVGSPRRRAPGAVPGIADRSPRPAARSVSRRPRDDPGGP